MPRIAPRHAVWVPVLVAAALALSGCNLIPLLTPNNNSNSNSNSNSGGSNGASTVAPTGDTGSNSNSQATGDTVDIFSITVGDCLTDDTGTDQTLTQTQVIDCAQPHTSEVYSSETVPEGDGTYPGDDAITQQAQTVCVNDFTAFIGIDYNSSSLNITYLEPTASSWEGGDREILCLVVDPAGNTTGSLQGAAR